ncbi:copper resistance protein CopC [Alicyclobacillus cellulosilyticus]|uniref:copper resistance protein CopC n=1 Tax=Alicyclobacillus cellulosilyticus TaxID=1003997 RepID=UPI001E49F6DF|nr:copper resistance protein CopC [Alicyclobacillus cellulosilyticus]
MKRADRSMRAPGAAVRRFGQLRALLAAIVLVAVCFCTAPGALAHAYVVKSSPAANQVLTAAPHEVKVWFDEPVQPVFDALVVLDQRGRRVDRHDARLDPHNHALLVCTLADGLGPGTYTVDWRVISDDGHPVQGVIPFAVGAGRPAARSVITQSYLPAWPAVADRWAELIAMAVWFGLCPFWRFVLPPDVRKQAWTVRRVQGWLRGAWLVLAAAVLFSLPLEVTISAGVGWGDALEPGLLHTVLAQTRFGQVWLMQALLVLVLLPITALWGFAAEAACWSGWLLSAGLLATRTAVSHAAASFHPVLSMALDLVHLAAASVWVGGLAGMMGVAGASWRASMRRFTPWAAAAVAALVATGLYAARANVPTAYAFTHTAYGWTLAVKITLVAAMVGLGFWHWLHARTAVAERPGVATERSGVTTDQAPNRRRGRAKTLLAELLLGVVVLGVTSVLTNLPPAASDPGPVYTTQVLPGGIRATLTITPNRVGVNRFTVALTAPSGRPASGIAEVTLSFRCLTMDMGVDTVRLRRVAPGQYQTTGMYLTMAGPWLVHLHVLTAALADLNADVRMDVGSP